MKEKDKNMKILINHVAQQLQANTALKDKPPSITKVFLTISFIFFVHFLLSVMKEYKS